MRLSIPAGAMTAVVVLAAIAAGSAIDRHLPSTQEILARPFITKASLGQEVAIRTGTVTATGARTARSILADRMTHRSEGVWLVVDLGYTAKDEPWAPAAPAFVAADGTEYSDLSGAAGSCRNTQTGLPLECTIAIEVAPEDLPGMSLRLAASARGGTAGDDVVLIDLGIAEDSPLVASPEGGIAFDRTRFPGAPNEGGRS